VNPRRNPWIWLIAVALGFFILLGAFYVDRNVQEWRHEHRWKNITLLSRNVTHGTDWPVHIVVGSVFAALAWWRGSKKWTRVALAMIAACALAGISTYALKISTGRVRPSVKIEKVWGGPTVRQNFHSFPSGHTAASFGFFSILFFVNRRLWLLLLPVPLFVAFTRIFLGAHYFSDVVGAALLGILCAAIVAQFLLRPIRNPQPAIG
jgi:membrane-associated phospholipid phosphatase